ncbi:peptidoglycan bridge formation glycyltransferase FemA/FemB family protein [Candidatus Microgenomates bacterium]|nr:MAG: peptidoglycan bridge formation glycyltransferase FemA/FemB family protein [Candidatus Microgenomates bacterium]
MNNTMKDIRQSATYAEYLQSEGWVIEKINNIYYFIKNIPVLGSVIKLQRPSTMDLNVLGQLARKYRAFYIIVEPTQDTQIKGFRQASPYLPSKTIILDVSKPIKQILSQFTKDAKYSLRKSEKVKVEHTNDVERFSDAWIDAVASARHIMSVSQMKGLKKCFKDNCVFLLAEKDSAGGIFLVANNTGYYWHGFANAMGRKTLSQYQVVWKGIKWAKKRGAEYFDFEGIYDDRFPIEKWKGFTRFKIGFGGKIVEHPGAFAKWRLPV